MGYLGYYRLLYYSNYSIGFVPLGGEDQENSELFPWQHVARVQVLHFFCLPLALGQGRTVRLSQTIDFPYFSQSHSCFIPSHWKPLLSSVSQDQWFSLGGLADGGFTNCSGIPGSIPPIERKRKEWKQPLVNFGNNFPTKFPTSFSTCHCFVIGVRSESVGSHPSPFKSFCLRTKKQFFEWIRGRGSHAKKPWYSSWWLRSCTSCGWYSLSPLFTCFFNHHPNGGFLAGFLNHYPHEV